MQTNYCDSTVNSVTSVRVHWCSVPLVCSIVSNMLSLQKHCQLDLVVRSAFDVKEDISVNIGMLTNVIICQ